MVKKRSIFYNAPKVPGIWKLEYRRNSLAVLENLLNLLTFPFGKLVDLGSTRLTEDIILAGLNYRKRQREAGRG